MSTEAPPDYAAEMRAILEQPLTPRVIEGYAESSLRGLVELITNATVDYVKQLPPPEPGKTPPPPKAAAAIEDDALAHFNVPGNISDTLQHLADTAHTVTTLGSVISSARHTKTIITPPVATKSAVETRGGSYPTAETIPRLKTVLFILAYQFGVDPNAPGAIDLELGAVHPGMRRNSAYNFLRVPILNRTILVCDEVNNATYIFADDKRRDLGLTDELLKQLTKPELDEYIESLPELGVRIIDRSTYVDRVAFALKDIENYHKVRHGSSGARYNVPRLFWTTCTVIAATIRRRGCPLIPCDRLQNIEQRLGQQNCCRTLCAQSQRSQVE